MQMESCSRAEISVSAEEAVALNHTVLTQPLQTTYYTSIWPFKDEYDSGRALYNITFLLNYILFNITALVSIRNNGEFVHLVFQTRVYKWKWTTFVDGSFFSFIQLRYIKLIKSDTNNIYNVTKDIHFK